MIAVKTKTVIHRETYRGHKITVPNITIFLYDFSTPEYPNFLCWYIGKDLDKIIQARHEIDRLHE